MAEVRVLRAQQVGSGTWHDLKSVLQESWEESTDRSPEEIDYVISGGGRNGDFIESHLNPNSRVGKGLYNNQQFTRPLVAIAAERAKIVGYAYMANNVSGGGPPKGPHSESLKALVIRQAKRLSVVKNYAWLREVAVLPEFQGHGIAKQMGKMLLEEANGRQPVSAYVWPDEDSGVSRRILEDYGFKSTREEELNVFGPGTDPTTQVRMQANSVKSLLSQL